MIAIICDVRYLWDVHVKRWQGLKSRLGIIVGLKNSKTCVVFQNSGVHVVEVAFLQAVSQLLKILSVLDQFPGLHGKRSYL